MPTAFPSTPPQSNPSDSHGVAMLCFEVQVNFLNLITSKLSASIITLKYNWVKCCNIPDNASPSLDKIWSDYKFTARWIIAVQKRPSISERLQSHPSFCKNLHFLSIPGFLALKEGRSPSDTHLIFHFWNKKAPSSILEHNLTEPSEQRCPRGVSTADQEVRLTTRHPPLPQVRSFHFDSITLVFHVHWVVALPLLHEVICCC